MQALRWSCEPLHNIHRLAQILEEVINFRWGALPDEQREGIWTNIFSILYFMFSTVWRRSWRR